jgi:Tfp pilus assembly protein PilV
MRLRELKSNQRGTTLLELIVAAGAGTVIFMGLTMLVVTTMHQTTRTGYRVHATQEARVVLQRLVTEMHSACVAAEVAPIQPESNSTSLAYVYQTGSGAALTPVVHKVSLSGNTLTMSTYPSISGSTPSWTFATTPTSTTTLMTRVAPPASGSPIFTYYSYSNGAISSSPLPVPLSEANAAKTVQVNIALKVEPGSSPVADPKGGAVLQNSAYLRYSPPGASASASNLPCE